MLITKNIRNAVLVTAFTLFCVTNLNAYQINITVNDNELIVTEYTEKVMKDNPAMLDAKEVPEHIARHDKWIKHQKTYDDNYELFKKWALGRKEERQKRIEESKERSRLRAEEIKANKSSQKNEDK